MLGVQGASAEEFHSRCTANAQLLRRRSRELAGTGQMVPAVLTAWAADVAMIEAILWERTIMASSTPLRDFFAAAERFTTSTSESVVPMDGTATAADVVRALRAGARGGLSADVVAVVDESWTDISFLRDLPAPTHLDLADYVTSALGGRSPGAYVVDRRQQAHARMDEAHAARVRGDVAGAIELAFDADFLSLEAYLVESAEAAGDVAHGTVVSRFTLASAAVAQIPGLPGDYAAAVGLVRKTMADALGGGDGERLRQVLEPV